MLLIYAIDSCIYIYIYLFIYAIDSLINILIYDNHLCFYFFSFYDIQCFIFVVFIVSATLTGLISLSSQHSPTRRSFLLDIILCCSFFYIHMYMHIYIYIYTHTLLMIIITNTILLILLVIMLS